MIETTGKVLVVDDESRVVNSIRRLLLTGGRCLVEGVTSPVQALELLRRSDDFRLVLSDYMMPEMDGLSLLAEIGHLRPEIIRIMLTGHADLGTAVRAINEVGVHKFILKPWNNDDLYWTVMRALEFDAAKRENELLKKRLGKQQRLLRRFEELYPGITRLERDADGAIVIDEP